MCAAPTSARSDLVAVALADGAVVEGSLRPSSDTPTHRHLYLELPTIGGVVHTHSTSAAAWAQAARPIPRLGTTHADYFRGPVLVSRQMRAEEVDGDYEWETGRVIVETLPRPRPDRRRTRRAVLVRSHGPFAWGATPAAAVEAAIALEEIATIAWRTLGDRPVGASDPGGAAPPPLRPQARRRRLLRPAAPRPRSADEVRRRDRLRHRVGRAVLVDLADGRGGRDRDPRVRERRHRPRACRRLDDDVVLEPDWALQDPDDYVATIRSHGAAARSLGRAVDPADVVGVGIDFTALHDAADDRRRHAALPAAPISAASRTRWVKLWKHHAAQPEADRINATAAARGEPWLPRYGGRISSEWFYAKGLQILDEAPRASTRAADRLIEAADWIVWQLTGVETRERVHRRATRRSGRSTTASRRPTTSRRSTRASRASSTTRCRATSRSIGERAGGSRRSAQRAGQACGRDRRSRSRTSTPHVSVPAVGVTAPGTMVAVMGTSNCHLLLGGRLALVEGMCGVVEDGIVPGFFGYEAGQSAVGDIFAWFTEHAVPPRRPRAGAPATARTSTTSSSERRPLAAGRERPARARLVERQSLDPRRRRARAAASSGATLATRPADIYRALLEIDGVRDAGDHRIARARPASRSTGSSPAAGLPERNELLMQIYRPTSPAAEFDVAASSAGARARARRCTARSPRARRRGGYDSIADAAAAMVRPSVRTYRPDLSTSRGVYDDLYRDYLTLHDHFGRGGGTT